MLFRSAEAATQVRHLVAQGAIGGGAAAAEQCHMLGRMLINDVREVHGNSPGETLLAESEAHERDDAGREDGRQQQAECERGCGTHGFNLSARPEAHRGGDTALVSERRHRHLVACGHLQFVGGRAARQHEGEQPVGVDREAQIGRAHV